jgi:hypothetical protein
MASFCFDVAPAISAIYPKDTVSFYVHSAFFMSPISSPHILPAATKKIFRHCIRQKIALRPPLNNYAMVRHVDWGTSIHHQQP